MLLWMNWPAYSMHWYNLCSKNHTKQTPIGRYLRSSNSNMNLQRLSPWTQTVIHMSRRVTLFLVPAFLRCLSHFHLIFSTATGFAKNRCPLRRWQTLCKANCWLRCRGKLWRTLSVCLAPILRHFLPHQIICNRRHSENRLGAQWRPLLAQKKWILLSPLLPPPLLSMPLHHPHHPLQCHLLQAPRDPMPKYAPLSPLPQHLQAWSRYAATVLPPPLPCGGALQMTKFSAMPAVSSK